MFVYVLTGRASKPVLCSIYTKSTEQLNYFQKTGLRALNIVCGQRSTYTLDRTYILLVRNRRVGSTSYLAHRLWTQLIKSF